MHQDQARRAQRGVTLIEQVMVVAILAVMAGLAAPSLHSLIARNATQAAQTEYIGALQFARYTAAIKNTRMLFCPTLDRIHCSNGTQWSKGWLVGADRNHDNQPDGPPLRVGYGYARLKILSSIRRRHVSFQPDGSAGGSNLTLLMCPAERGQAPLRVVVSNAGRVRGARATREQAAGCAN